MEGSHSLVECTGLENRRPSWSVGSNPTPSAKCLNDVIQHGLFDGIIKWETQASAFKVFKCLNDEIFSRVGFG